MTTRKRKPLHAQKQSYQLTRRETAAIAAAQEADFVLRAPNTAVVLQRLGEKYGFVWHTVYGGPNSEGTIYGSPADGGAA